jgi:hypothetical protein
VNVTDVAYGDGLNDPPKNPLELGELDALAAELTDRGLTVRETWNGHPGISGSVGLDDEAHPTLRAAVETYPRAAPPTHARASSAGAPSGEQPPTGPSARTSNPPAPPGTGLAARLSREVPSRRTPTRSPRRMEMNMSQIHMDDLDEGDELGELETPICCDVLMDNLKSGFQCGQCDAHVNTTPDRVITHIARPD